MSCGGVICDILEFNAVDLHTPLVGGIVHDLAKFAVNLVAWSEALVQVEFADNITQAGFAEFFDCVRQVRNLVDRGVGVSDLEIKHGIDFDGHIVFSDHILFSKIENLFA